MSVGRHATTSSCFRVHLLTERTLNTYLPRTQTCPTRVRKMKSWRFAHTDGHMRTVHSSAAFAGGAYTSGIYCTGFVRCLRVARASCNARAILVPPMNSLTVGTHKKPLIGNLPDRFLLIDDGELIDQVQLPPRRKAVHFDVSKHSFNPMKDMTYFRAREFISIFNSVFPEGESTLTKRSSNYILLNALLERPKSLSGLIEPDPKSSAHTDAFQKVETLLVSPILASVLCKPANFSFNGTILARLDRAALGDFDCFVIANFLISNYKGHVIIPDFGFYGHRGHMSLIRQGRLTAGVNYLEESAMRNELLLIDHKIASHCTAQDAEVLAGYSGLIPHTNAYNEFVSGSIM